MEIYQTDLLEPNTPWEKQRVALVDERSWTDQLMQWGRTLAPWAGIAATVGAVAMPLLAGVVAAAAGVTTFASTAVVDNLIVPTGALQYVVGKDPTETLYPAYEKTHQVKEFTVSVDGFEIDAVALVRNDTDENTPWMVRAGGNGEFMAHLGRSPLFGCTMAAAAADEIGANILSFDYPGVGHSGYPSRTVMWKTYRLMLDLLERGGAKKIIAWGDSIGGAVQSEALMNHTLKDDVHYIAVKRKTFSSLPATVGTLMGSWAKPLISLLGWNMDNVACSKMLQERQIHEIIVQEAKRNGPLCSPDEVIDDDPIKADASLAKALLQERTDWSHKTFIGDDNGHMNNTPECLAAVVEKLRNELCSYA